ncbi:MAG: hypothetical protein AAFR72_11385 [Pseudomonadota bacterium]
MVINILLGFFRLLGRFFGRIFRGSGQATRTATKAGSSMAAKTADKKDPPRDDDLAEPVGGGLEAMLFKQLARPRLSEQSASDLTLEDARIYLQQAERFYTFDFNLFARSDFFYEEVEEDYLNTALGLNEQSIDARFLQIMSLFRRTLNDNTRRLMVVFPPLILSLCLGASAVLAPPLSAHLTPLTTRLNLSFIDPHILASILAFTGISLIGVLLALLIFSWPFKVAQQRNLLNLDNYLTSKFARINHNFQVAKRRALNVERNKRMSQVDALKDEAGVWTLSYQWFAMRLLLCEQMIRNRLYQVRRNTILYWLTGIFLTALVGVIATFLAQRFATPLPGLTIGILSATALYLVLTYGIYQRTTSLFSAVLEENEWSRFHLVDLHRTIQDHVGEDKVQIVTFRDRNRME